MNVGSVRVDAHAKLTLSLRVVGVRADGYHELDALTVSVTEPHDVVTLTTTRVGAALVVEGTVAGEVPVGSDNLATAAALALQRETGRRDGVKVRLRKEIPPGGGLGGGSSDAAAVLVGLRALWGLDLRDEALAAIGAALGSDVPFCVRGGAAWMRGRGEVLEPVDVEQFPVVIAVPPFGCPTPAVYRAWDESGGPRASREIPAPAAVSSILPSLGNDLELAAEHVEPRLAGFRAAVERAAGRPALLAGSGSAYAVCFDDAGEAERAHARVRSEVTERVWVGAAPTACRVL